VTSYNIRETEQLHTGPILQSTTSAPRVGGEDQFTKPKVRQDTGQYDYYAQ